MKTKRILLIAGISLYAQFMYGADQLFRNQNAYNPFHEENRLMAEIAIDVSSIGVVLYGLWIAGSLLLTEMKGSTARRHAMGLLGSIMTTLLCVNLAIAGGTI